MLCARDGAGAPVNGDGREAAMGLEIERKFLVTGDSWRVLAGPGVFMKQGYLSAERRCTVRVRLAVPVHSNGCDQQAWLTVKGPAQGGVRLEFEYAIPPADAVAMLPLCGTHLIEKTRFRVPHEGRSWEVDVFAGANEPLVLAEIELDNAGQEILVPDWVGAEITDDERYHNASLARCPYRSW
jgi:adenylate cyclase